MKVTLEKKEKNQVYLEVEVDNGRVKKALEQAFRSVSQQVNIPGFRKGKAPRQLVERAVGPDYIKNEALNKLVPEALEQAVQEQSLEMIDRPDVEVISFEDGQSLVFKASVPVRPEVEFNGDYKDNAAQAPKTEIDPAAIDAKIEEMRQQRATQEVVERAIEQGDFATLDFSGKLKGEEAPFEGGTAEDFKAEIAPGRFIDGFMENLIGMKTGEEKDFDITFPEQYHAPALAGQPATFHVHVKEVRAKALPAIDDHFAAAVGDYITVADLTKKIEADLLEEAEDSRELLLRQQILDQVLEKADVEIPESMIQREIQFLMNQYAQMMQAQGMDVSKMFDQNRINDWANSLRDEATKRIKTSLTLGTVAKANGIIITNEEVDEEIVQYAAMYKVDPAAVRNQLIQSGGWTTLADEVLSNKILDWLREQAKVTEGPIPEKYAPKPEGDDAEGTTEEAKEDAKPKKAASKKKAAEDAPAEEGATEEAKADAKPKKAANKKKATEDVPAEEGAEA
ncbi:MAG: trigger factor [Cyanobacteria bacterium RYN_339]|nr:trigger factor [Cyanobacteria bacterium RYN_339]